VIEVLFNDVTLEGMRHVKVVSDEPLEGLTLSPLVDILAGAHRHTWMDELLGLHYLEATWPCREAVSIRCEGWPCARDTVLWKLLPGERVSEAFRDAFQIYLERFKRFPDYAFLRRMPKEIENGFEMSDVIFLEAAWMPAGCIAICEGEHYGLEAMALQK